MKTLFRFTLFFLVVIASSVAHAQSGLSISVPFLFSKINPENNWSPPSAVNRKDNFDGSSIGYQVKFTYSFNPSFLIKNKDILFDIGIGFFNQRFNVERPFDYDSPFEPIFYTDYYKYSGWQWSVGGRYNYTINQNYFLSAVLTYTSQHSIRQEYHPTKNGVSNDSQTENSKIHLSNSLTAALGINRKVGKKVSAGMHLIAPILIRWRNDKIFNDKPDQFWHPQFTIGASVGLTYHIE